MLLMFERGIRGGIIQAVHRCAMANNKYMDNKLNSKEESSYLQYLDANNLYGWAMIQNLPTGGFEWVNPIQLMPDNIDFYANCENEGYLSEVDVKFHMEIHDHHNDLPFVCEKMKIISVEKLVPNLNDRTNYVTYSHKGTKPSF